MQLWHSDTRTKSIWTSIYIIVLFINSLLQQIILQWNWCLKWVLVGLGNSCLIYWSQKYFAKQLSSPLTTLNHVSLFINFSSQMTIYCALQWMQFYPISVWLGAAKVGKWYKHIFKILFLIYCPFFYYDICCIWKEQMTYKHFTGLIFQIVSTKSTVGSFTTSCFTI